MFSLTKLLADSSPLPHLPALQTQEPTDSSEDGHMNRETGHQDCLFSRVALALQNAEDGVTKDLLGHVDVEESAVWINQSKEACALPETQAVRLL